MIALFVTVLVASVVGSMHCAGMCGAFVAFAVGAGEPSARSGRAWLLSMYQLGRLLTYGALGAAAGMLGAGVDLGGHLVGLQRAAAIVSGAMMVSFGSITLLRLRGVKLASARPPRRLASLVSAGHRQAMRLSPPLRALATGLLTTLLPCGWLYAFVITAAGTGHAWSGAFLMAAFWAGTLPILTFVGAGIKTLAAPLAARLPAITASTIVMVGVYTIIARAGITLRGDAPKAGAQSAQKLTAQVLHIDQEKLPCCTRPADSKEPHP